MTVHSDADLNQAAADAACSFLQHYAPAAAPPAVPYVPRLFAALADGHSFIWLSAAEAAALAEAAPLVSRGGNTPLVLDSPHNRNALSSTLVAQLHAGLREARQLAVAHEAFILDLFRIAAESGTEDQTDFAVVSAERCKDFNGAFDYFVHAVYAS